VAATVVKRVSSVAVRAGTRWLVVVHPAVCIDATHRFPVNRTCALARVLIASLVAGAVPVVDALSSLTVLEWVSQVPDWAGAHRPLLPVVVETRGTVCVYSARVGLTKISVCKLPTGYERIASAILWATADRLVIFHSTLSVSSASILARVLTPVERADSSVTTF